MMTKLRRYAQDYTLSIRRARDKADEYRLIFHRLDSDTLSPFLDVLGEPADLSYPLQLTITSAPFVNTWSRQTTRLLYILGCPGIYHVERCWLQRKETITDTQIAYYATETALFSILTHYLEMPTDPALITTQFFSEHCRHRFFHRVWQSPQGKTQSLIDAIRSTQVYLRTTGLEDHAGVLLSTNTHRLPLLSHQHYVTTQTQWHYTVKTETHNHPTATDPFIGAATGVGGEIRDLMSVGQGGRAQAGFYGLALSDLSSLKTQTLLAEAPLGVAHFANEFGRPTLLGFLRYYEQKKHGKHYAFDKPILLSGGIGRSRFPYKTIPQDALIYVIGGPSLPVALGEAAHASHLLSTTDPYTSHQGTQPEIQRSCAYVLEQHSEHLYAVHDIGAGGLINALLEILVHTQSGLQMDWGKLCHHHLPQDPISYLCNESQERFICLLSPSSEAAFIALCRQESCPAEPLGCLSPEAIYTLTDNEETLWSLPIEQLLSEAPTVDSYPTRHPRPLPLRDPLALSNCTLSETALRVLAHPSVSSKHRLIHRFDRSVGGLTAYESVVGPYQIPVGDFALSLSDYDSQEGLAFALGERIPIAPDLPEAAVEMALGEAITNLCGAGVTQLSDLSISANWMAYAKDTEEASALIKAVQHLVYQCCHPLHIGIITGKDSLSMNVRHEDGHEVLSPVSLVVAAFAHTHYTSARTPVLSLTEDTDLFFIDLSAGSTRLGSSIFEHVIGKNLGPPPRVDTWSALQALPGCLAALRDSNCLLAYHDRSDGGLWACLCEMAIASRCGMYIILDELCFDAHLSDVDKLGTKPAFLTGRYQDHLFAHLFTEELGVVIQTPKSKRKCVGECLRAHHLYAHTHLLGSPTTEKHSIDLYHNAEVIFSVPLTLIRTHWFSSTLPDSDPQAIEKDLLISGEYPALSATRTQAAPCLIKHHRTPVAMILRAPGNHGQEELARVLQYVGFEVRDISIHTCSQRAPDQLPHLLILGAGFSYSDFPTPGSAWIHYAQHHPQCHHFLTACFQHASTLVLGICNGCQALSQLATLMPGAPLWPEIRENHSQQFESRIVNTTILDSPSIFLHSLIGESLPIVVAHRYGLAHADCRQADSVIPCLAFSHDRYPLNPNGSARGYTGFSTRDGRILGLMPHPERMFLWQQSGMSFLSQERFTPWVEIFYNAYLYACTQPHSSPFNSAVK